MLDDVPVRSRTIFRPAWNIAVVPSSCLNLRFAISTSETPPEVGYKPENISCITRTLINEIEKFSNLARLRLPVVKAKLLPNGLIMTPYLDSPDR